MTTEAGRQFIGLTRSLARENAVDHVDTWVAAIEAEARDEGYALAVEMERAVAATERAALLAELEAQHRRVETVTQDGDDWTGCLCGEPDDNCLVLLQKERT